MPERTANFAQSVLKQNLGRPGESSAPRWMSALSEAGSARSSFDWLFREQLARLTKSTFVSFARMQESVSIWAADSRGMQFQVSPLTFPDVSEATEELLRLLGNSNSSFARIEVVAKRLSGALFSPLTGFLEESRGLIVHFGGDLRSVPLSLFRTSDGNYLLERYSFVHAMDFPWQPEGSPVNAISSDAKVLIVEAPALGDKRATPRSETRTGSSPDDLLFIASALPYNDMICRAAATRVQFNRLAPQAEVLHCRAALSGGAHGPQLHLASQTPELAAAKNEDEGIQPLTGYRRQAFSNCILAVFDVEFVSRRLSDSPDLWHGASLAMHYAGIRNVIIPRWNVPAGARQAFHQAFYASLKEGRSISESFQRAARSLRAQSRWRHPHHWAGFTHTITHL